MPAPPPAPGDPSREAPNDGSLDPELLAILVCPLTRGPLRYDARAEELISDDAQLAYPVRDGVPVLIVEEARFIG